MGLVRIGQRISICSVVESCKRAYQKNKKRKEKALGGKPTGDKICAYRRQWKPVSFPLSIRLFFFFEDIAIPKIKKEKKEQPL